MQDNNNIFNTIEDAIEVFSNGDMISVTCYDYSKEHGSQDHLNLNLQTKEFGDFG